MSLYASVPRWIKEIPDHIKTQVKFTEAVRREPYTLDYVPDYLGNVQQLGSIFSYF